MRGTMQDKPAAPSILATKQYSAPSVFRPENLRIHPVSAAV